MKKQAINFSWPVELSDFKKDEKQENFSRGKLKVFYKGETADHRFFSDSFSEELIKSLPYTPVVSSYDEEKQDFVGHASEQQILGIVDPCTEPTFEKDEDGTEWCNCDVVLYTERPDTVGILAQKIVGHPQSLELDPNSVQYKINYDEKKHFKNIEFTAGRFVGVSVLGNDQKPAFTGSSFFSCNEKFEEKMQLLRNYCETKHDQRNGGNEMNLQEFIKLSWGDTSQKVADAITKEYENDAFTYVVDMFDDCAIVNCFYYLEEKFKMMKIHYTCDESGNIVLGKANEVHIVYEDLPEDAAPVSVNATLDEEVGVEKQTEEITENVENPKETFEESNVEEVVEDNIELASEVVEPVTEEVTESIAEPEVFENEETTNEEEVIVETSVEGAVDSTEEVMTKAVDAADISNAEVTQVERVENDEEISETESSSSTTLNSSERAEFEALKRDKKIGLVDSYKENLTEEEYDKFIELANSDASEEHLELELLKVYKASTNNKKGTRPITAFAFAPVNSEMKAESALDAFVRKNRI